MQFRKLLHELNSLFPGHFIIWKQVDGKFQELSFENLENRDDEEIELTDDSRNIHSRSFYFSTHFAKPYLMDAISRNPFAIFINKKEWVILKKSNINSNSIFIIGKKIPDFYLGHTSSLFYNSPSQKMKIIAVTGTNGKTTTTFMIYHLWKKKNIPCAIIGTLGIYYFDGIEEHYQPSGFTTPRAYEIHKILYELLQKNIKHVAMEASSEALALRRMEGLCISKAIFMNLTQDHLNFHKSMNYYFFSKLHLFFLVYRHSNFTHPFIVVYDVKLFNIFYKFSKKIKTPILYILENHLNHNFVKVQPQPYLFNQYNSLCAYYAVLEDELYTLSDTPLEDFSGVPGRMEEVYAIETEHKKLKIYVDYAHTPDAMEKVLKELKKHFDFIITVFGCGGDRDKEKRPKMGEIASLYSHLVIITDDNPRTENPISIREEIIKGISADNYYEIGDRKQAIYFSIQKGLEIFYKRDHLNLAIYIAGKGHENYQIIGKEKKYFSDREEVKKYFKEMYAP